MPCQPRCPAASAAADSDLSAAALAGAGLALGAPFAVLCALVWVAHVGFDRLAGYGLKYATGFGDTHLGPVGRRHLRRPERPSEG